MNNQDIILKVILLGDVIGYLAWDDISRTATFQFTDTYHKKDYNLQPTRPSKPIPAFRGIPGDRYHGLPPFIADSLPDNWGSLVFGRWAKEKGLTAKELNPLVKLAYIGRRGMGALEFMPEMDMVTVISLQKDLTGKDDRKLLSQTMAAIIPNASDYQNLFFLCRTLKLQEEERTELFRRMCFNVVAGNTDGHNKNFSFLMYPDGHWELSPAYDMTFTADIRKHSDGDVHSLGIYTKSCYLSASDLITFGEDFEIKNPEYILSKICETVSNFRHIASELNIPELWTEKICDSLDKVFPEREQIISH